MADDPWWFNIPGTAVIFVFESAHWARRIKLLLPSRADSEHASLLRVGTKWLT